MRRIALLSVAAVLLAAGAAVVARAVQYHGVAKPGVHVLGVDVGGQSRTQIAALVGAWDRREITIAAAGRSYHVARGWLVSVDAAATAAAALRAGSATSLVVARRVDVQPVLGRAGSAGNVLHALSAAGRAAVSATVELDGTRVSVTPSRVGLRLDRRALLRLLEGDRAAVAAPFASIRPARITAAADTAARRVRALIARPLRVDYHGALLGSLDPVQLAATVHVTDTPHGFAVTVDGDRLATVLRPRLGRWIVRARNAHFVVSGAAVHVAPSRPGRDLDAAQLASTVEAAATGSPVVHAELLPHQPDLTTARANALGITRKLVSYTTQMGVSSSNRIHNVHLMADFIDGTVIRPGETFSFNDVVGPRTAKRGFLEGQEIVGSLVLPSIGGGVCQTATTLFNDAFEAGLPILARVNHNLYLSHYPLGRDATVSWGGPDFRFRNDLKHGILIKAAYTDQTLTFTFYGTPEGRRVVSHTGPQVDWTRPAMTYAVDPRAPRNSVKVVPGSGELGFDVTVDRTVYDRDGRVLRHNIFKSHYIPDSSTTVYGPGRTPPGPYFVVPAT